MGKTSVESRLNIPGKWAWAGMEAPGFLTLLFIMWSLPRELAMGMEGGSRVALPWENWGMAALFVSLFFRIFEISFVFVGDEGEGEKNLKNNVSCIRYHAP